MKTIELPIHGIVVEYDDENPGGGSITCSPDLYETCPKCGQKDCLYQCDESQAEYQNNDDGSGPEDENVVASRHQYNGAVDGITSMILAHVCAGIDIESPAYLEGIETAFQAAGNNA